MAKIVSATTYVLNDEPCYFLAEQHKQPPDSSGFRRFQIIRVIRNGECVDFVKDMGKARDWKDIMPLTIIGFGEHTVGEMIEQAEDMRSNPSFTWDDVRELMYDRGKTGIKTK
uniref:Uncharacterized protein n=1 Tax=viral metagenome TaxID=1070528 RepID=A0A6M3IP89_9ZZZZ